MYSLSQYQRIGLKYCLSVQHPALLWKMRLRKTIVIIRWMKILNKRPVLIMCPNSAIYEWQSQLEGEGLNPIILNFKTKEVNRLCYDLYDIFIINHEGYRRLPEIGTHPWKIVILDESHQIRNERPKFTKFCLKNFRQVEHRVMMTGTWMPETELDLFNQLAFLSSEHRSPYRDYWHFRNTCTRMVGHDPIITPKGSKWINEKLKLCSVMEYADAGVKDQITEIVHTVELPKDIRKQYDKLITSFILENDWVQKATISSGARYVWMRQLIGGFIEDKIVHKAKLNAIDKLLSTDLKRQRVVIWSCFNTEVELMADYFQCPFINGDIVNEKRNAVIESFKRKQVNILSANPACFAHGGNLSVADAEIYYSLPEKGLIFNQSKRRIFDIDQKISKPCIFIVAEDTLDMVIVDAHKRKVSVSTAVYEYAKRKREGL